jgi:hypothetical protein
MDIADVLGVFTNPHTEHLHDRQVAVLRRLLHDCRGGFRFVQLPTVCALLDAAWARAAGGGAGFLAPLQELIALCALPLLRDRANEEFTGGAPHFERLVHTLGTLLHAARAAPPVQIAACAALRAIAQGRDLLRSDDPPTVVVLGAARPVREDLRPLPRDLHLAALLRAGAVAAVARELAHQVALLAEGLADADAARGATLVGDGTLRTHLPLDDDDDDDDAYDGAHDAFGGGGVGRGRSEVSVATRALKAELVSALPRPTRELLDALLGLVLEVSADPVSTLF